MVRIKNRLLNGPTPCAPDKTSGLYFYIHPKTMILQSMKLSVASVAQLKVFIVLVPTSQGSIFKSYYLSIEKNFLHSLISDGGHPIRHIKILSHMQEIHSYFGCNLPIFSKATNAKKNLFKCS